MKETRDEILYLADSLLRTRGFNAFSYRDISGVMDVRNATIHYYFPTKSDLAIAVIEMEMQVILEQRFQWVPLPPDVQLKKIIETFFRRSRGGNICLTGSLTPDYPYLPEPLQKAVKRMVRDLLEWVSTCLENGRRAGIFYFQGEPADRALLVMSSLLSSLLFSRVQGDEVFDRMIGQMLKDLGSNIQISEMQIEIPEHLL